jgi:iron(III) transport system ATP-binding protein
MAGRSERDVAYQNRVRLRLRNLCKTFGGGTAVDDVSIDVVDGEFLVLLGPSGCGKTTLLRMIAGFIQPDQGSIELDGREIASSRTMVPPEKRNMAMVFQSYALWPNKTIFENVAFGLRLRRLPYAEISERVAGSLRLLKIEGYQERYPPQLSGGEQQRVALARALIVRPSVFLFDEPLSNLDASLREELRFELKELQAKLGITSIYVTHDQSEAMVMADRIAVLYKGAVQQLAPAKTIYERPSTPFVCSFIGQTNLIRGEIQKEGGHDGVVEVLTETGICINVAADSLNKPAPCGQSVTISIRPENITLSRQEGCKGPTQFRGKVIRKFSMGSYSDYRIGVGEQQLRVQTHPDQEFEVGEVVFLTLDVAKCHCILD